MRRQTALPRVSSLSQSFKVIYVFKKAVRQPSLRTTLLNLQLTQSIPLKRSGNGFESMPLNVTEPITVRVRVHQKSKNETEYLLCSHSHLPAAIDSGPSFDAIGPDAGALFVAAFATRSGAPHRRGNRPSACKIGAHDFNCRTSVSHKLAALPGLKRQLGPVVPAKKACVNENRMGNYETRLDDSLNKVCRVLLFVCNTPIAKKT